MSILPSSTPKHRIPAGGRSFGAIVAAETLKDAEAWINEVSGTERVRRLALVADMLIAANPEQLADEADADEAAEMAVETLIERLNDEKQNVEREAREDVWSAAEETAVKTWSPFRTSWAPGRVGPRWVCKSGRYGNGELATAGTAVRS